MKRILSIVAGLAVVFAGAAAPAKEHHEQGEHHDEGKHLAKGHHKFDDHDREVTRSWCVEHRERLPVGFRPDDRLAPEFEARLKVGTILDVKFRDHIYPVPSSLVRLLAPPPVNMHYIAIGGHIGLLDGAHRLQDLLPLPPF
jgi:Ni/Co efflux regulator RcnB